MKKHKCPMCKGSGVIEPPKKGHKGTIKKIKTAKGLRKSGHSIRSIQNIMGYSSPSTIQYLLNKKS